MTPVTPPLRFEHLSPLPLRLGAEPRHFRVSEIPAYSPLGEGDHLYLWVEKEGQNTQDVAKLLAQAARVPFRDVGYAGMKDRNAITRQWFSLPKPKDAFEAERLPPNVRVLETSWHRNKLRTGHLIGNRFELTLIASSDGALSLVEERLALLAAQGYGNYFGPQRFGRDGKNLEKSLLWARGELRHAKDEKLLSSVLQSELWNRMAARRLTSGKVLLAGEVVRLAGTGKHFVVEDIEAELPRATSLDILPTLPMWGPRTVQSKAEAKELEDGIIAELGLTEEMLHRLAASAPGARRDLLVRPTETHVACGERENEVVVSFALPAGSFATEVLRELLHTPWNEPREAGPATREAPSEEAPA
jgi:tRNA pseudouridine13 synthase